MPTFGECIADGIASGAISAEVGAGAHEAYQNAYADAARTMGPEDADRAAGAAVIDGLEKAKIEARRRQVLSIRKRRSFLEDLAVMKRRRGYSNVSDLGGAGGKPPPGGPAGWTQGGEPPKDGPLKGGAVAAKSLPLLLRNKGGLSGAPFKNGSAEGQSIAIRGLFDARMAGLMEQFETRTGFDTPNRALLGNIGREVMDGAGRTGDKAAAELADAWNGVAELSRQMFNAEGGVIGKIEGWLPQIHDPVAIRRMGKGAWIDLIAPLLDRSKMVDRATGAPITPERLTAADGVLSRIHDRIITKGLIDRYPPDHGGVGMLANQRGEERFLYFKGYANWATYQRAAGAGDLFAAMMSHLDGMAHDIGLMRVLGPNPEAQWAWLKAFAMREATLEEALQHVAGAEDRARSSINRAQDMYDSYTGKASVPVNQKLAQAGGTIRSYLNGADLGSAILSDMPSAPMFGALARSFMGVKLQGDMGQFAALLADPGMRAIARRSGFINEVARDGLVGVTQDTIRSMTAGEKTVAGMNSFARKLPSSVMRLQGLSGLFEARRRSFRMSFMGALADAADKPLATLAGGAPTERALAAELDNRGFTDADWDAVRTTPAWEPRGGVRFLRPQDIADHAGLDHALRVGEMVVNAEQYAVPVSGSLWTRAYFTRGTRPGTAPGELARSFTMFHTFAANTLYQYGEEIYLRGLQRFPDSALGQAGYMGTWAAGVFGALTLAGMMSLQLKRVARGEDPIPMNTPQAWGAAILQGGGLGILGDFFFSRTARNDKSAPIVAAGPTGQLAGDVWDLTGGEALDVINHNQHPKAQDHEGRRLAHDLAAYTPFASEWWARLAFDRMIVDQLEQAADPDAKARYQQAARTAERQTGAGAWWPRGAALPARAPDVSHLAGAPPPQ